jgi:hypothetical protein
LESTQFGYRLGDGKIVYFLADYILGGAVPNSENAAAKCDITREQ